MLCQASERCRYLVGITLAPAALLERIGSQLGTRGDGRLPSPEPHANPSAGPLGWGCEAGAEPLITTVDPPDPTMEVPSYLDGSWSGLLSSGVCLSPWFFSFRFFSLVCLVLLYFKNALKTLCNIKAVILHLTLNASELYVRLICCGPAGLSAGSDGHSTPTLNMGILSVCYWIYERDVWGKRDLTDKGWTRSGVKYPPDLFTPSSSSPLSPKVFLIHGCLDMMAANIFAKAKQSFSKHCQYGAMLCVAPLFI